MARIRILEDIGVPVGVGLADVALQAYDDSQPAEAFKIEPLLGTVGSVLAGVGVTMGIAPNLSTPLLHACLPMGTKGIYTWIKSQMGGVTTRANRKVTRTAGGKVNYEWKGTKRIPYLV